MHPDYLTPLVTFVPLYFSGLFALMLIRALINLIFGDKS